MELEAGAIVEGRVTRIVEFGAFVEFPNGESGLVHISQVAHEFVKNIRDHLNEGDVVSVLVLGRDEKGRLDLSIKELTPAPVEPPGPSACPARLPSLKTSSKAFCAVLEVLAAAVKSPVARVGASAARFCL